MSYIAPLRGTNSSSVALSCPYMRRAVLETSAEGPCAASAGVEDDGFPRGLTEADLEQSLTTLRAMAAEVHAIAMHLRTLPGSCGRSCAVLRVHRICRNEVSYVDLRIAGGPHSFLIPSAYISEVP